MRTRDLLRDDRGGIAVFGVVMAMFLVGAVYFLVSVSNVALQREGLQQVADSSVFSASVVSARAMNAIAVMNVLMQAVMAVLLPLRALAPAYADIAKAPCADACSCEIARDAARASEELTKKSIDVEKRGRELLAALSDAQTALAAAGPELAAQAATRAAELDRAFVETPGADLRSASLSPEGCRLGLPVEEDTFRTVCKRARPFVDEIAHRIAKDVLDTEGTCKSGPKALAAAAKDLANPEGRICREAAQPACFEGGRGGAHPKRVFAQASNGSDWMQYWSTLKGRAFDSVRAGVEVAAGDTKGDEAPAASNIGFAQSEIYFDCAETWAACNREEAALWSTRWTARLRRVHMPEIAFVGDGEIKNTLANAEHWNAERRRLVQARHTPWGGGGPTAASQLLESSEEGPLQ